MKSRSVILIIAVACVGFGAYKFLSNRSQAQTSAESKKFDADYLAGKAPILSGPYVPVGSPTELQFQVRDLKHFGVWKLAFDGDILCVQSKKGLQTKTWQVQDRDGRIKETYEAEFAMMSATGYSFGVVCENNDINRTKVFRPGGTTTELDSKSIAYKIAGTPGSYRVGTQAVYFSNISRTGQLTTYNYLTNFEEKVLSVPGNGSMVVTAETLDFGDIGYISQDDGKPNQLGMVKDSRVQTESIPFPRTFLHVIGAKSSIGITAGRAFYERIPYVRKGPSQYDRLAVPEGVVSAEVFAMNSKGDYLLATWSPAKKLLPEQKIPYTYDEWLVSGGRCYRLEELHETLFGSKATTGRGISVHLMNEFGDLVASSENGTFLLRRMRDGK